MCSRSDTFWLFYVYSTLGKKHKTSSAMVLFSDIIMSWTSFSAERYVIDRYHRSLFLGGDYNVYNRYFQFWLTTVKGPSLLLHSSKTSMITTLVNEFMLLLATTTTTTISLLMLLSLHPTHPLERRKSKWLPRAEPKYVNPLTTTYQLYVFNLSCPRPSWFPASGRIIVSRVKITEWGKV